MKSMNEDEFLTNQKGGILDIRVHTITDEKYDQNLYMRLNHKNEGEMRRETTHRVINKSRRFTADDVYDGSSVYTYELLVFEDEQQQQTPQLEDHLLLPRGQRHQEDGY